MNKTILRAKNSENKPLFDLILSGENSFSHSSTKSISNRRTEKGFVYSDTATIEPNSLRISGIIGDIPTLLSNLSNMPLYTLDETYKGILAGYYGDVEMIISSNPKKFSDDYRKVFNEISKTQDVIFDIMHPKDNTLLFLNYYLKDISIDELGDSKWGFSYNLQFQEIQITEIDEEKIKNDQKAVVSSPSGTSEGKVEETTQQNTCEQVGNYCTPQVQGENVQPTGGK